MGVSGLLISCAILLATSLQAASFCAAINEFTSTVISSSSPYSVLLAGLFSESVFLSVSFSSDSIGFTSLSANSNEP